MIRIVIALMLLASPAFAQTAETLGVTAGSGSTVALSVPLIASDSVTAKLLKNAAGRLYSAQVINYTTGTAGFLVLYDSASIPSAGALTAGLIRSCWPLPSSTSSQAASVQFNTPATFANGIVVLLTSATSCSTYTAGLTGFISGQVL